MQKIEDLARRMYETYADSQQWECTLGASDEKGMMLGFLELSEDKRKRWMLLALDAHRIEIEES